MDIGSKTGASISRALSIVLDEQAHPLGCVHLVAHERHEFPQAHSGQTMQQPVEPSLQPESSSARAEGNKQAAGTNQAARIHG
jgi:hypothetical protein